MNKTKNILIVCFCICFLFFACKACQKERQMEQMSEDTFYLQKQRDSLILCLEFATNQIELLKDSISNFEKEIIYTKEIIYEKVDSVKSLPVDSAIEYFTKQISLQANSQR